MDDEDYEALAAFKWCAMKSKRAGGDVFYAARAGDAHKTVLMHRFLMGTDGPRVDHENGNGLDNRRINLRHATNRENSQNHQHHRVGKTSRFLGVHWYARTGRWVASIKDGNPSRKRGLGYFDNEEDAARAYDAAARHHFGEFAAPNFPGHASAPGVGSTARRP